MFTKRRIASGIVTVKVSDNNSIIRITFWLNSKHLLTKRCKAGILLFLSFQ